MFFFSSPSFLVSNKSLLFANEFDQTETMKAVSLSLFKTRTERLNVRRINRDVVNYDAMECMEPVINRLIYWASFHFF